MNISKIKVITKYLTGGLTGVVQYFLDKFNELIQTIPPSDVYKYAQLAKDVATFIKNCCSLISNEAKKSAAQLTAQAFADLAAALVDSKLETDELDTVIESVKSSINAWKKA